MCGILGYTGFTESDLAIARIALHSLSHRGPDQWGEWFDTFAYIGHRRLSILDLSESGKQPMADPYGRAVIAVNGEIYNFQELRSILSEKHTFKSASDSEVLLYGYIEWGIEKLLQKIDGMFALCIYDRVTREMHLARDRFGEKPLYYSLLANKLFFASEMKALLQLDDRFRSFSLSGLREWIKHRGKRSNQTIFSHVLKLLPGEFLTFNNDVVVQKFYYDVIEVVASKSKHDISDPDRLPELLSLAVKKCLQSDVPVGIQLSGGIDSSLVACFIRDHCASAMHSFSIGFSGDEYAGMSEERYAQFVAKSLGFTHHQLNITEQEVVSAFEKTIHLTDGLLDYPNTIAIYLLSKYCKTHVTVALTGEGADELFGGYRKFRLAEALHKSHWLANLAPAFFSFRFISSLSSGLARKAFLANRYAGRPRDILNNLNSYIYEDAYSRIFGREDSNLLDDSEYNRLAAFPFYEQLLLCDHRTYLFSVLDRQDRASMGAAVETRLPFLDPRLVEWGFALRREHLFDALENKKILKELAAKKFGREFAYRAKRGFPLPIEKWIDNPHGFGGYLQKVFDGNFVLADAFDLSFAKKYIEGNAFDQKLLNYADHDRLWVKWFLMVIRTCQDTFRITNAT